MTTLTSPVSPSFSGNDYFSMIPKSASESPSNESDTKIKRSLSKSLKISEIPKKLMSKAKGNTDDSHSGSATPTSSTSTSTPTSGNSSTNVCNNTTTNLSSSNLGSSNHNNSHSGVSAGMMGISHAAMGLSSMSIESKVPAYVAAKNAAVAAAQKHQTSQDQQRYQHQHQQHRQSSVSSSTSSQPQLHNRSFSNLSFMSHGHQKQGSVSSTSSNFYHSHSNGSITSLPNMSTYSSRKSVSEASFELPPKCRILSIEDLAMLFESNKIVKDETRPNNGFQNLIIVDLRPFKQFVKTRIGNAINISLPTTLLKRANYTLSKTIYSLNHSEKDMFLSFLSQQDDKIRRNLRNFKEELNGIPCGPFGLPAVVLYDGCGVASSSAGSGSKIKASMSLSRTAAKFLDGSWNAPVFVLKNGFDDFAAKFSKFCDSSDPYKTTSYQMVQNKMALTLDTSSINSNSGTLNSGSLNTAQSLSGSSDSGTTSSASSILSGFQLPAAKYFFRVRQNDEQLNVSECTGHMRLENIEALSTKEVGKLPHWFLNLVVEDVSTKKVNVKRLVEQFNELEASEKHRLNNMVDESTSGVVVGLELGHKNRYKDILPFKNTRVSLPSTRNGCDYINASYLKSVNINKEGKTLRYIATQGPLHSTIGDFWRMVYENQAPLIISLTEEKDGMLEKCANYWKTQVAKDNGEIRIFEVEKQEVTPGLILRRIEIYLDEGIKHEVVQIQLHNWYDLSSFTNYDELLLLVYLKKYIMSKYESLKKMGDLPTVVHCSAGCGRTGTFCSLDSTIGYEDIHYMVDSTPKLSKFDVNEEFEIDPVYENVKMFRGQRLSMVQTLRQYLLIYDTMLMYYRYKQNGELVKFDVGLKFGLLDRFFSDMS